MTTRETRGPGPTEYQIVPPARLQESGSLSSLVAPTVVALICAPTASFFAWRAESFTGGRKSCAFSLKAASTVPVFLPTSTRYELPRVVSHVTLAVPDAFAAAQSNSLMLLFVIA